ncbi:MAG: type V CRISPR-associated protein Cas12b, partial [Bryobacterales bacterium]|nr:type V CRISPR-associated protein Cas12b [Bryobacterales bacterium]
MTLVEGLADGGEANLSKLRAALKEQIVVQRRQVSEQLLRLTIRILPLRGRCWEWVNHPEKPDCHLLRQTQVGRSPDNTKLRGQRGLSMVRIEQLSELRRRWQSLNQSLRRELGKKPLTAAEMRNDPIPDPCPDILRKLENIREQRVNQTAHLIVAHALGLKLREPRMSAQSRGITDTHGEYEVINPPVDMIVLEDLTRYLSEQGRAKSENTRLMKWCHRAVTLKVKMLAEPFGIPVLEI